MIDGVLAIHECLIKGDYSRGTKKRDQLSSANRKIEVQRRLLRLAHERELLTARQFAFSCEQMTGCRSVGSGRREKRMKRHRHLLEQVCFFENFLAATPLMTAPQERALALAFLLADQSLAYVRVILGPLLLGKPVIRESKRAGSAYPDLLAFAIDLLETETSRGLDPYPDWTRPCPPPEKPQPTIGWLSHRPSDPGLLEELACFMADPTEKSHDFKRAQHDRSHIEDYIKTNFLDLEWTTIKLGTPPYPASDQERFVLPTRP